jgi:hypothetical protein
MGMEKKKNEKDKRNRESRSSHVQIELQGVQFNPPPSNFFLFE